MKKFEISIGFYPGLLLGIRSYTVDGTNPKVNHVLYLPLIDLCITIYKKRNERTDIIKNGKKT